MSSSSSFQNHVRAPSHLHSSVVFSLCSISILASGLLRLHRSVVFSSSRYFSYSAKEGNLKEMVSHDVDVLKDFQRFQRMPMAHSDAAQYKKNGSEHYNLLGIIFNRSTATGVLHHSSTQAPPDSPQERELENEFLYGGILVDIDEDNEDDVTPIERATHSGKRALEILERKRKRKTMTSHMGDAIQAWLWKYSF
ncbi:L10-interacting MYB domain-containing protein [Senna tora]|uniref:L10-interacting MYB domain-containing protein n=1 Tax=Senna tora TaxID=362788 RepID=A0A834XGN3_9FABA|nr:L10-interacting MYB domain-containing protein [Senna tora]